MPYKVTANICVEVDDEQAANEDEAKLAAIDQLSDYFRHNTWVDLLTVCKTKSVSPFDEGKCRLGFCAKKQISYAGGGSKQFLESTKKGICPICGTFTLEKR